MLGRGRGDRQVLGLSAAQDLDRDGDAGLELAEAGHVIVEVVDVAGPDPGDDVAGLQTGGGGGAPGSHVGELDAVDLGGVVGHGAERDPEAAARGGRDGDLDEVEGRLLAHQAADEAQGDVADGRGALVVDLVEVVAGLVIVGVGAAEEVQHGQAGGVEAGLVGGAEAVRAGPQLQRAGGLLEQAGPHGGGADAGDDEAVVLEAADHVEVHHREQRGAGLRGEAVDEVTRAEQAHLLGAEGQELDGVGASGARDLGERGGEHEHGGDAGCVVVGAVVHGLLTGGERAGGAEAEVVHVGADHDAARAAAGEERAHVAGREGDALDGGVQGRGGAAPGFFGVEHQVPGRGLVGRGA